MAHAPPWLRKEGQEVPREASDGYRLLRRHRHYISRLYRMYFRRPAKTMIQTSAAAPLTPQKPRVDCVMRGGMITFSPSTAAGIRATLSPDSNDSKPIRCQHAHQ